MARKKKRGRPATGHDPVVPVRLPARLLHDINAWAAVFQDEHNYIMDRSAAIRCLLLFGLERSAYRAVDPKDETTYEGPTRPLLKFARSRRVQGWLDHGTGKSAPRKPPIEYKPTRRRMITQPEIEAAYQRALERSKKTGSR